MTARRRVAVDLSVSPLGVRSDAEWRSGTGKVVREGDVVRVAGVRGRWVVQRVETTVAGAVSIVVRGGVAGRAPITRAFRPDRVSVRRAETADRRARREATR